jgi:group II intron reverse transcriptase/maturase
MCGKQKTETESYQRMEKVVPSSLLEALNMRSMELDGRVTYHDLMELVVSDANLESALEQVVSNRGSPGIDDMSVLELKESFPTMVDSLRESILEGKYRPKPVKRVEIPKPNGGTRNLGIPTVTDRLVMQAIYQILMPIYEPTFSECSFGFRPGRNAHDAIMRVRDLYDEGYTVVVSLDLSKYFDTIPQDDLMILIRSTIKDRALIDLIKRFLKSGVAMPNGLIVITDEGSPQGSPLSPLLANIYLDRFDKEMERRELKEVRYADDVNLYLRTPRAAGRVMESATRFLEGTLKLTVNREKSAIGSPMELKFLGFRLCKLEDGTTWIRPHEKAVKSFKSRIREITRRHRGTSVDTIVRELRSYMRGWFGYFGIGPDISFFDVLDAWVRHRMRAILLVQWKTPRNRQKQLNRIGGLERTGKRWDDIRRISYKRHVWRASKHISINYVLNNQKLKDETGMYYMTDDWEKVQARFPRSPLRSRTVGSVGGRQTTLFDF